MKIIIIIIIIIIISKKTKLIIYIFIFIYIIQYIQYSFHQITILKFINVYGKLNVLKQKKVIIIKLLLFNVFINTMILMYVHFDLLLKISIVALQFPEGLQMFACTIADILEK